VDEAHITLVPSSISQAEKGRSFGIGMALKELEPLAAGEATRVWGWEFTRPGKLTVCY